MGASRLVPVIVKFVCAGNVAMTPSAWQSKYCGKPNDANLAKHIDHLSKSFLPGGVNEHCGPTKIVSAEVIRQSTGEVLAKWTMPMFEVIA